MTRKVDTKSKRRRSLFDTTDERNKVAYEDYQCLAMLFFLFCALSAHLYIVYGNKIYLISSSSIRQQIHFWNKFKIKQENFR